MNKIEQETMEKHHVLCRCWDCEYGWRLAARVPNPFPKPTPEVQCLRNVSEALYNAWVLAEYHGDEPTELTEKASQIAYDAYVAVRKLLGDEVK